MYNAVIAALVILLLFSWFGGPNNRIKPPRPGLSALTTPEQIALYEEMWQREEKSLWDWLENHIAMESIAYPTIPRDGSRGQSESDHESIVQVRRKREESLRRRRRRNPDLDDMSDTQIQQAIGLAEERLQRLRNVVKKRKRNGGGGDGRSSVVAGRS